MLSRENSSGIMNLTHSECSAKSTFLWNLTEWQFLPLCLSSILLTNEPYSLIDLCWRNLVQPFFSIFSAISQRFWVSMKTLRATLQWFRGSNRMKQPFNSFLPLCHVGIYLNQIANPIITGLHFSLFKNKQY